MSHFTYSEKINTKQLSQGDVLRRTTELDNIIKDIHPYFFEKKDQYHYFQIITQSCDLVRRSNNKCKAQHITISVVRDLESILNREFNNISSNEFQKKFGFFDDKKRVNFKDFLKKLIDNNIPKYFYLHPDPNKNFNNQFVTTLRVNIALKSELHYDTLLSAKILELNAEFKAKIGWLVGNLYSRVGTQDWVPDNITSGDFDVLIDEIINHNFMFVPSPNEYKKLFRQKYPDQSIDEITKDEFLDFVSKNKLPKKREVLKSILSEILLNEGTDSKKVKKIIAKTLQNPDIARMLR